MFHSLCVQSRIWVSLFVALALSMLFSPSSVFWRPPRKRVDEGTRRLLHDNQKVRMSSRSKTTPTIMCDDVEVQFLLWVYSQLRSLRLFLSESLGMQFLLPQCEPTRQSSDCISHFDDHFTFSQYKYKTFCSLLTHTYDLTYVDTQRTRDSQDSPVFAPRRQNSSQLAIKAINTQVTC